MSKRARRGITKAAFEKLNESLDAMIERHGWAVLAVFADPDTNTPTFSYTVGLTAKNKPEMIVMGMPPDNARIVLNGLARRLLAGEVKRHERLSMVLTEGYEPVLIEADTARARDFLRAAIHRYGDQVQALQLVLPDAANRLPWEEGFDRNMMGTQLILAP